jgi:tRNA (cytidine/uridine-2'-O-)-methyltransferase
MFHVILYQPEIPPNTGNVIRLCANTGCTLHLIEPLGFDLDEPRLKRAGLDYHELAVVRRHASFPECLGALGPGRVFAVETGIGRCYTEASFQPGDALLFGRETTGLPPAVLAALPPERCLSIPMLAGNRSLNLSNAVAVAVYEAWRQQGFASG